MTEPPLAGVRVLDVGSRIAAPFCAGLLAEHGAEVIKVEQPGRGEYLRELAPQVDGYSLMWAVEGRSRRSVTLDLRKEAGQALFRDLAATADVLCENFRPGTMERWGIGPDDLSPELIYVRVSTFGQTGPYRDRPGVDLVGLAQSGVLALTGQPGADPVKSAVTVSDHLAGTHAATAALAALVRPAGSRPRGVVIDASLCGSMIRTLEARVPAAAAGDPPARLGNGSELPGFHGLIEARDGFVAVAAASDGARAALEGVSRDRHGIDLEERLASWARETDRSLVVERLRAVGVPVAAVADAADLVRTGVGVVEVDDPVLGPIGQQAPVPAWPGAGAVGPAPVLDADGPDVWCGLLGLSPEELQTLRSDGLV